jgi:hypothetical protein
MIEAGVAAYDLWDYADEPEMIAISIYRAMQKAKGADFPVSPPDLLG